MEEKNIQETDIVSTPNDTEKTLRVPVEKTQRLAADKTLRISTTSDSTVRPTVERTQRINADSTLRPDKAEEINKIVNQYETRETHFTLADGTRYNVVDTISRNTGEAQIYLVENKGNLFALKLYYPDIYPLPNHDIMEIIRQSAESGFLVNTPEHGKWTHPQTKEVRDYERMMYCAGGSLEQIQINNNETLLCEIAVRCGMLLDYLHRQKVIHRDVKPGNFFFTQSGMQMKDLVLGDFGIAIQTDDKGNAEIDYRSQLRTRIYAAPEYYYSIDGRIQINTKSDFYSLGMMLLTLWNGEEIYKIPEFELVNLKRNGNLPYPENMSERTLQLIKALTLADPNSRAGFPEIARWMKGETIYESKAEKDDRFKFNILFNASKNQTAHSPEELALFMFEDKDLSIKYLYSGKISQWLTDNLRPELAMQIETFVETQYPRDKEAGLMASCYLLNPQMPFHDVTNKPLTSSEEIALSLKNNFAHYNKALANSNDSLFLFLSSHGAANMTKRFAPLFKTGKDNSDILRQMIFAMDPSLPWTLRSEEGKEFDCQTPEDIIQVVYEQLLDDESWNGLIKESFLSWISYRDKALAGKIRSQKGHDKSTWCVLYNLSPKVAYNLQMDENADNYFFTAEEIGNYMNLMMENYIKLDKNSSQHEYANDQLNMMCYIDDTRLFYYFKSKAIYDDKIAWIKHCADVKSKENTNKAGPYNWRIGIYKAIKGLGYDPYYYFPQSNKKIHTPGELSGISSKEIKKEIADGFLDDWLSIFYQEDPSLDLSTKYTYERKTVKYIEYLEKLDKSHTDVKHYRIATKKVRSNVRGLKRKYWAHLLSKFLFGGVLFALTAAVIYGFLVHPIPFEFLSRNWILYSSIGLGLLVALVSWFADVRSFFGLLLIAALVSAGLYYALKFSLPYLNYAFMGILGIQVIMTFLNAYIKIPVQWWKNRHLLHPGFEERYLEPLHFAYLAKAGDYFHSSIEWDSEQYGQRLKTGTKKFYRKTLSLLITTGIFALLLVFLSPTLAFGDSPYLQNLGKYEILEGSWEGTFEGQKAVLNISKASQDRVDATIEVHYQKLVSETLEGQVDLSRKTIHFDDVYRNNGFLDGEYNGTFNEDMTTLEGIYQNYTTKKQVKFQFKKQ